jgi:probable F420-dependent oxidoreductase
VVPVVVVECSRRQHRQNQWPAVSLALSTARVINATVATCLLTVRDIVDLFRRSGARFGGCLRIEAFGSGRDRHDRGAPVRAAGAVTAPPGFNLGRVGVYAREIVQEPSISLALEFAAEIEELGFRSVWFPETNRGDRNPTPGREAISVATLVLAATKRIVAVNAIARVSERSPAATLGAQVALAQAFPGRHILGLGFGPERSDGSSPLAVMSKYLQALDDLQASSAVADEASPVRMLAAYGPQMLELSATRTAGPHAYKVTPAFTAHAREMIGPAPFLAVEQAALLEPDPVKARAVAREHLAPTLATRYNRAKFQRLGYSDADIDVSTGGSNRFVDDFVAWGDEAAVYERVLMHLSAGADLVTVQLIGEQSIDRRLRDWRRVADVLSPIT